MSEFTLISRDRLYEGVVEQVTRAILAGRMRPGNQLPTEADLCEMFGVSRTVVREAIRALMLQGLVVAIPGRGTFIKQPSVETVVNNMHLMLILEDQSFDNLMFVRELLEVPGARLAAEKAAPADIQALAKHLEGMRESLDDAETFIAYDTAFHAELAYATKNVVLTILLQTIMKMLQGVQEMLARVPEASRRALDYHEQLYRAVASGDCSAAEDLMRAHLAQAANDLGSARDVRPPQPGQLEPSRPRGEPNGFH